jgi:glycosyltransferase involved in cell wall biosynthesis
LDSSVQVDKLTNMRILFASKSHWPNLGGTEVSTHHLASALQSRGHTVTVLAGRRLRSVRGLRDLGLSKLGRVARYQMDESLGYLNINSILPDEVFLRVTSVVQPSVVVVTATDPRVAKEFLTKSAAWPTVLYVRDLASSDLVLDAGVHKDAVVANSRFLAGVIDQGGLHPTYLPSLFDPQRYRVETTRETALFINPIPKKGLATALALAEHRPDVPFAFVPSWRMKRSSIMALRRRAKQLGNVQVRRSSLDPRDLYGDARLLLLPSLYPEAWARVASEAQVSGIPVIGSRVGGIPESVGPGGILVDSGASIEEWLEALSKLWDDQLAYGRYAKLARHHSERPELAVDAILNRFEETLTEVVARHQSVCARLKSLAEGA